MTCDVIETSRNVGKLLEISCLAKKRNLFYVLSSTSIYYKREEPILNRYSRKSLEYKKAQKVPEDPGTFFFKFYFYKLLATPKAMSLTVELYM